MIQYVNHLLNQWGIWCISGREKLGYPRQAAFLNGQPHPSGGTVLVVCDEEAMQINRAVQALDRDLRKTVEFFYIKMRSCDQVTIGKALGISDRALRDRLDRAQIKVMYCIQEDELQR